MEPFFIVGPTAVGKSEIAAAIASQFDAEIVSADAFQLYRGLDLLSAKPDEAILAKAPHHLLGVVPLGEEMNVEKFRAIAVEKIAEIRARKKQVIVAGGSGLYVKALTHGLSRLPAANPRLRAELNALSLDELIQQLGNLDPAAASRIDLKNRRRLMRAIEICLLTGKPVSKQRDKVATAASFPSDCSPSLPTSVQGVFLSRDRADLYQRINRRVEMMFQNGVVEEVRTLEKIGSTAEKMLGLQQIRALVAGEMTEKECIATIQQATRRYAKRQLTWFGRQHNFTALNLSPYAYPEAIESIAHAARLAFAPTG
jgi:tRNA dimethylallyltransferase